jgi:hypothetical protein
MTNLNLDLIEKVRQQKAAVQYNSNVDNLNHLQALYEAIYPNNDIIILGNSNYYYTGYNGTGWSGEVCPINMEAIPLSAFFIEPNLSLDDKALIKETSDLLKQLKPLLNKVDKFIYQPIDTIEGEQEQGKEWKKGEWAWNSYTKTFLGIITRLDLSDITEITLDNQDGKSKPFANLAMLVKPSPEEIKTHLVAIAEKKGYKPNVYIRSGKGAFKNLIEDGANFHYTKGMLMHGSILIWCVELGWATILPTEIIAPIETEQRWRVEVMLRAGYRDDVKIVVTLNDGFISESSGRQLAEAIKQYLSTNKV